MLDGTPGVVLRQDPVPGGYAEQLSDPAHRVTFMDINVIRSREWGSLSVRRRALVSLLCEASPASTRGPALSVSFRGLRF